MSSPARLLIRRLFWGCLLLLLAGAFSLVMSWPDEFGEGNTLGLYAGWIAACAGQLLMFVSLASWSVMLGIRAAEEETPVASDQSPYSSGRAPRPDGAVL